MSLEKKDAILGSTSAELGFGGDDTIEAESAEVFIAGTTVEKSLVRKFDTKLLPLLTIMYLFNSVCPNVPAELATVTNNHTGGSKQSG